MANRIGSFQCLERRLVLDAVAWVGPSDGAWNLAANWFDSTTADNRVPTGKDNVTIDTGSTATVNILPGDNLTAGSLTIGSNDTLSFAGGAQLTVNGAFSQAGGSSLDFSLGGSRAGLDYGVLDVEGSAALGGTINVTLAVGYTPGPDDAYQPLVFASQTGTPTVNAPAGETDFLTATSLYVMPAGSANLSVTNTADSGSGSLRAAIATANASANPVSLVTFDMPTSDPGYSATSGVWTIAPLSALPTVTAHAIIDATTQPGYVGKPVVQLDGASAGSNVNGLNINGGHSRVAGLGVGGFNGDAIELSGVGFDTLAANFLGTDTSGNVALANGDNGIFVNNVANNTIGGIAPGFANVVSSNGANGILINGAGASDNLVAGNFIGTNITGATALGNKGNGIQIGGGAANNTIGGAAPGVGNVISGNGAAAGGGSAYGGVFISDPGTAGNLLEGNFIGTDAGGAAVVPNFGNGVAIQNGATNNTIGGTAAGAGNVISGNGYNGVVISGAGTSNNRLLGNRIGSDASGVAALGNKGNGVQIVSGATNNSVGGTAPGAGNVISGNGAVAGSSAYGGVFISDPGTAGNLLEGNFIGTDAAGAAVVPNFGNGVAIQNGATNNTIGGIGTGAGNVISGNGYNGVFISDAGTSSNLLLGNFIGTNAAGSVALGNSESGVVIRGAATDNTIGGTTAGAINVISGNGQEGVWIGDVGTSQNLVEGNHVGTNATGDAALGNGGYGVTIQGAATNNTLGGAAAGAGNTISGNASAGVWIADAGTSNNSVEGNLIGTDAAGNAALGNDGYGVTIQSGATNNTIGAAGAGNVISGNGTAANGNGGVYIGGAGTSGNVVAGNRIGVNATGNAALANSGWGVVVSGAAANNTIGGTTPGMSNVISGNGADGVWIGGAGTSRNSVEGNFIGTNATGNAALGNGRNGIAIRDGATGNTVGGAGAGNTISFNTIDGVLVDTGTQNLVSENSISSNGHLGIELSNNGNNGQAAPTLESASGNNTTTVVGSLSGTPNTTFTLEFFANPAGNPSSPAEGQTFVGVKSVTTNASGIVDFSVKLPVALPANQFVLTATATDANNNTSSFSNSVSATATPFTLNEDVYVIGAGTISFSAANGLLQNDTGPTPLTVTTATVTGAEGGTFAFNADGSFTYTPPSNFLGFDYAKYTAQDTSGDSGTSTVNVLSQTGGIVWKFYEQVLDRDPDYAGLQFWINDFTHGGSPGDIAAEFFESTELLTRIIDGFYEQYLGRAADSDGLDFWIAKWRQLGGPEQIIASFASSPEFNALANAQYGGTAAPWLEALYHRVLNRAPDPGALNFWPKQLAGGESEFQVALTFVTSPEAYGNDVTGWFYEYLGRAPTPAEQSPYVQQMLAGLSDRDIEEAITNLAEYSANPPASPPGVGVRLPDYFA